MWQLPGRLTGLCPIGPYRHLNGVTSDDVLYIMGTTLSLGRYPFFLPLCDSSILGKLSVIKLYRKYLSFVRKNKIRFSCHILMNGFYTDVRDRRAIKNLLPCGGNLVTQGWPCVLQDSVNLWGPVSPKSSHCDNRGGGRERAPKCPLGGSHAPIQDFCSGVYLVTSSLSMHYLFLLKLSFSPGMVHSIGNTPISQRKAGTFFRHGGKEVLFVWSSGSPSPRF